MSAPKPNPKQLCDELRALGRHAPSPESHARAVRNLTNKWEGVQVCAATILSQWGGRPSVSALRAWLLRSYEREAGWSLRGQAAKLLARCVTAEDAEWIVDLYFAAPGVFGKHELLPLVVALPVGAVRARFREEMQSTDRDKRQATMKAIIRMPFPERTELLTPFTHDPDPDIQRVARWAVTYRIEQ